MGRVAEHFSDYVLLTSDNPRNEDSRLIIEEIIQGMKCMPLIELDRRLSIEKAIKLAKAGDTILIAGKGHEKMQVFADRVIPFDDFAVTQEIVNNLKNS